MMVRYEDGESFDPESAVNIFHDRCKPALFLAELLGDRVRGKAEPELVEALVEAVLILGEDAAVLADAVGDWMTWHDRPHPPRASAAR